MMHKQKFISFFMIAAFFTAFSAVAANEKDYSEDSGRLFFATKDDNFALGVKSLFQQKTEYSFEKEKHSLKVSIPRARLKLFGRALHPRLTYLVQAQLEHDREHDDNSGLYATPGSHHLLDYYVNIGVRPEQLHFRFGKFTAPFSRHYLASGAQLRFAPLDLAGQEFLITDENKDVGFMLHSGLSLPWEYSLAFLSNGISGRVGYSHHGIDGFELVDFRGGSARYGVGVGGYIKTNYQSVDDKDYRATADYVFKLRNFASNGEVYYRHNVKQDEFGASFNAGYLIDKKIEPGIHYSWYRPKANDDNHEVTGALNYYLYGHHLKAQGYVGAIVRGNKFKADTIIAGLQLQFAI